VGGEARRALVAYAPAPDGVVGEADVRFLSTVAGHLAAGLDKARVHAELARHRDRLEDTVRVRTEALRKAYEELRALDGMKDRFLSNLSHELRSPVTAIVSAATALKNYSGTPELRAEMADAILEASQALDGLLGSLFRLVGLESGAQPLQVRETAPTDIAAQGIIASRARAIAALAAEVAAGSLKLEPSAPLEPTLAALERIPGIGPWTAQYIAMRALAWPDAFPHPDVAVLKAMRETSGKRALARAESWRPWRSYAVLHLWKSLEQPHGRT
jgi:3-methyladenine DNA glycosylase/8-oxoguanine DNA glycosylase